MKNRRPKQSRFTINNIAQWLTVQSIAVIAFSIGSFLVIELAADMLLGVRPSGSTVPLSFTMALPMVLFLSGLNYYSAQTMAGWVNKLSAAMSRAANGRFDQRLSTIGAGPLAQAYEDYNTMCEELQNVQELRSDFTNSYSHEFKTPIVSINGFAELLLQQEVTDEERRLYLEIIRKESANLADLADSTILMGRLDSLHIVTNKAPYALDEQLRYCVVLLAKRWHEKGIEFTGEIEPAAYNGNEELMQHLWLNLIGNAVKFTSEGGRISTSLRKQGNSIVVTVEDTGIGMEPEQARRIFDRYYQADASRTQQGLGLGLSIVQRIVDLCSGTIQVESEKGRGSRFTVTLPQA